MARKKTLRRWAKEELWKILQEIEMKPNAQIITDLKNYQTWNKIIWFLEWVSEYEQISFIKRLKKIIKKRNLELEIDVIAKMKQFALKNKARIIIPN